MLNPDITNLDNFSSRETWQEANRGSHYRVGLFNAIHSNPDLTTEECDALVKTYFDAYPHLPRLEGGE